LKNRIKLTVVLVNICLLLVLINSVWAEKHSNQKRLIGIYASLDDQTLKSAKKSGVDIFYPSITWFKSQSWVAPSVERAHKLGFKVYPSVAAAYDGHGDNPSDFARKHPEYWEKKRDGTLLDRGTQVNLSWGHPEVRKYKVETITDFIVTGGFDGILLDYTRFFGNNTGYCDKIVSDFTEKFGKNPFDLADDDPEWIAFRAAYVTDFVAELRKSLHEHNPKLELIACVGPDPCETLSRAMQDWGGWLDQELIDGVVTMIYERDTNNTLKSIMITNKAIAGRVPHIPMVACWGDNLNTPEMLKEAAMKCFKLDCQGVAIYRSDSIRELNLWPAIAEIARWPEKKIASEKINYVLNPGFENDFEFFAAGYANGVEISRDKIKSGNKSLKFHPDKNSFIRQIIDRGFLKDKNSVKISGFFYAENSDDNDEIFIEANLNYKSGLESFYRVPIKIGQAKQWNWFESNIELDESEELNFILMGIKVSDMEQPLYIDDLELNLSDEKVSSERYKLNSSDQLENDMGNLNILRGQVVKASSFWDNGWEPENAIDGDIEGDDNGKDAAWHSQRPPKDQWLKVYLPQPTIIRYVRMLNTSAQYCYRTRDYRIEVSVNDLDYKQVASGTLPNDGKTWTEIEIDPVKAKYIKFVGVNSYHPEYTVGLKEIEAYSVKKVKCESDKSVSFSQLETEKKYILRDAVTPPLPHDRYGCYSTPMYYLMTEGYEYKGDMDKDPQKRVYKSSLGKPGPDYGYWKLERNRPDWQEAMVKNWAQLGLNNTHLNIYPSNGSLELSFEYRKAIEDHVNLSQRYGLKVGVRLDALGGYEAWPMHPNNPNNILKEYLQWVEQVAEILKGKTAYYILGDELTLYKPDKLNIDSVPSPEDFMGDEIPEDYKKWTPDMYMEYFKTLSTTIKSIDPDAKVSMFASSSGQWFNVLYLLEKGYAEYGDAVSINYYNYRDIPKFFNDAEKLAPGLEFLSNGVGYVANGTIDNCYPENNPYSKMPTEEAHANMIAKNMFAWWDLGADTAPYYVSLRNWIVEGKVYPRWFGFFGFEDFVIDEYEHLTVKRYPGWYAFQTIAHTFYNRDEFVKPNFDVTSTKELSMFRCYLHKFQEDRELLMMLWNDSGQVETQIEIHSQDFNYPVKVNTFNYQRWEDQPFEYGKNIIKMNLKVDQSPLIIRLFDVELDNSK